MSSKKQTKRTRVAPMYDADGLGYGRISKLGKRDAESNRSFDEQDEAIAFVAARDRVNVLDVYREANVSGAKAKKPELEKLMARIEDPSDPATALVVPRLSRLARSVELTRSYVERVLQAGGSFHAGDFSVKDPNSIEGKVTLTLLSLMAEIELDRYRDGYEAGRKAATADGIKVSKTPIGYEKLETKLLVKHPIEGDLVTKVFQMRASGKSWNEIRHFWHSKTGKWVGTSTFAALVKNRAYLGELRNGGDYVKLDAIPRLIDEKTWLAAQTNGEHGRRAGVKGAPSLLGGIARCASCGHPLTTTTSGRPGAKVRRYVCSRANRTGSNCERGVTVQMSALDEHVEKMFLAWADARGKGVTTVADEDDAKLAEFDRVESALIARQQQASASFADIDVELDAANAALVAVQEKLDALRAARDEFLATRRVAGIRMTVRETWAEWKRNGEIEKMNRALDEAVEHLLVSPSSARGSRTPHVAIDSRVDLKLVVD
jgi:DNA invertase Pin-like site-specific DNA recombinase